MTAMSERNRAIRRVIERLRRDAGDVSVTALREYAELDVLCAEAFAARKIEQYAKLAKLRFDYAIRLRIVPPLPRGKVSDEEDLDPIIQANRERYEREQRQRQIDLGIIDQEGNPL